MSASLRLLVVLVLIAALVVGYRWWNSAERQINRVLDGIASGLSHDRRANGLGAVAAAAGVQQYFSVDVVIEPGREAAPLAGRDTVLAAVARVQSATPTLHVSFVDRQVILGADRTTATVNCSASARVGDRAGQESVDARQVVMTLRLVDGHWVVERVAAVNVLEPVT